MSNKPSFNLFHTIMLVSGSMIGSGVFIVSADIARTVGSAGWLIVVWLLSGLITLFAALSYGELAAMLPKAGGQFVYIKEAFGDFLAFLYGWTVFMVIQTGVIAAVAMAFAKFSGVFFPFFEEGNVVLKIGFLNISSSQLLAIAIIFLLSYINTLGINKGKLIQTAFTSAKLIALFGLIIVGIYAAFNSNVLRENLTNMWNAYTWKDISIEGTESFWKKQNISGLTLASAIGVAMIGSLFSSDAWNNVTFIAGDIKKPERNLPLGLFFGVLIVTIIYVLANFAYLCLLPVAGDFNSSGVVEQGIAFADKDRVATAALSVLFGDTAKYILAALIMISTFGCNNGLILAGARLFESMANHQLFFKTCKKQNKHNVPVNAIKLQGIWASILCLSGSYGSLLDYCTFSSLLFYIITIIALFVLRKKLPNLNRPYKAWGYPIIPVIYIILTTLICVDLLWYKTLNCGLGLLIIVLGIPVYYLFKRNKSVV